MLGVADYQRIRTNEPPVLGLNTNMDPVAEFTKLRRSAGESQGNRNLRNITS